MATTENRLSIADVEASVGQFGGQMTSQLEEFDRVMRSARHEPVETPIRHWNVLSALAYTKAALHNTHHRFEMVTGSDRILHTLEGEFREMLRRIVENRSRPARVIVANGQPGRFQQLAQERPEALRVTWGTRERPVAHFFTSDFATAREEAAHHPLTDDMDASVLFAEYYPNCRSKVVALQNCFSAYWKQVTGEGEPPPPPKRRWWSFGK